MNLQKKHLMFGIPAALAVIVVASLIIRSGPSPAPTTKKPKKTVAPAGMQDPAELAAAPEYKMPVAPATREVSKQEVARAMDLSNIRTLVVTLKEAAATDNEGLKSNMLMALKRYGPMGKEIIQQELSTESKPMVRDALEQALANAR